jgi:hypothetical protein
MTTDELDLDTAFDYTSTDLAGSGSQGYLKEAAHPSAKDALSYSSNVYWQISVNTDDLEDLD